MGATSMPTNNIVPITTAVHQAEPQKHVRVRASTTWNGIEAQTSVVRDAGLRLPEPQDLLRESDRHVDAIAFRGAANVSQTHTTYWIAGDGSAGMLEAAAAASGQPASTFSSFDELNEVTSEWPMRILVTIWNKLPGRRQVARFENRRIALERLWREIQTLAEPRQPSRHENKGKRTRHRRTKQKVAARQSKTNSVLDLLRAPGGATLAALMKATGWQAHSVRGFLSQKVSKQLALPLQSVRLDGQRVYALVSQDQDKQRAYDTAEEAKAGC